MLKTGRYIKWKMDSDKKGLSKGGMETFNRRIFLLIQLESADVVKILLENYMVIYEEQKKTQLRMSPQYKIAVLRWISKFLRRKIYGLL